MSENERQITYADAGVDIHEGARAVDAIRQSVLSTKRDEVLGGLGGFGSLFSAMALKNMEEPILVSGTDGVGTKLALAQRFNKHTTVGQDLVAMCVDDIVVAGAEPLFFLDYIAIGKLKADHIKDIVAGIAQGCRLCNCALVGGEMAEHPGVMSEDDYDLAGFVVGVVDRPRMLKAEDVKVGDVIVGLPSSGIHSNGYSLVRRVLDTHFTDQELLEPREDLDGKTIAEAVLEPTIIYAGAILQALKSGAPIHAMAHITGGGITENLNRILPDGTDACVYRDGESGPSWNIPPIISLIIKHAHLSLEQAYSTFNMGVGMSIVCDKNDVDEVCEAFEKQGFNPFVMGEIVPGNKKVIYRD